MTKEIIITRGRVAVVDDEDYDYLVSLGSWYSHSEKDEYAVKGRDPQIFMHKVIMQSICGPLQPGFTIDHIDTDKLNNRRHNLRIATLSQQAMNRPKSINCSSKYKGVTWDKGICKWRAMTRVNKKLIHLGSFSEEIRAAKAYNDAAVKYFGEFACLNVIE